MSESHIHFERLPNGLTLLLREARLAPVADLQIWALVGSADERPGEGGLAHFHEHMLFKGTARRGVGDIAAEVEGAGGRINAYTSFDVTVYHATMPSDAISTGVDVLVDSIRNSTFDPDEVRRETEVVLEEIRRSEDSPGHVLGDAVFREAFRVHPYGRPILGPAENVASFTRERVMDFFHRWYTPDNLVVVAAGDFDARELAEELRAAMGDAQPGNTHRARPTEPARNEMRSLVLTRPFERVRIDLSWPGPTFRDPVATHLDLLSFILGECESSRLVRGVKERDGMVDRIDSSSYTPLDPGIFSVNIEGDSARAEAAIEATIAEIARLCAEPVSRDELERARANFLASEHFERESVSGMASKLGAFHNLGGDWRGEALYFDAIRSATPSDLQRAAQAYLDPERVLIGAMLPEDEAGRLDDAKVQAAARRGAERQRRAFSAARLVSSRDEIESYEFSNGVRLHVQARHEVPVVALRGAFLGGLLAEDAETAGLTSFTTSMWLRGTRSRSASDFARTVENLASDVDGFSGRNSLGVTVDVTSDKLEPSLDLMAELLLEPAFDPEEIERERREVLAAIERREDRLAQQAYLLFTETLYEHHPYRLPMNGTRESVASFDAAKIRAHHERLVQAENLVIAVSGDVDPDQVAQAISVRLAALPSGDFRFEAPALDPIPDSIRTVELVKERAQAHLVLGFAGLSVSDPDRHTLEVIAQVLAGQGGRLFLELRDRQSLAYSVSAANVEGVAPGFFSVYIATAPDKIEPARVGILRELERLTSEPPADDELSRAKRYLVGSFAIDSQRNSSHAAHMSLDGLYGLGAANRQKYPEQIGAITKEEVLRVAQKILNLDAYTLALVHP